MNIYAMTTADAATMTAHLSMMLLAVFTYRHALEIQPVLVPVRRPGR